MPWVRFDDQFPIHRKVDRLSDAAYRLHTSAIFWSARNLTDGFVSEDDLDGVTSRVRTPARFASECVNRDTWHEARFDCPSEKCPGPVDGDGWIIHDYWAYQPSKAQVMADREKAAERQAKWREAKTGRNAVTQPNLPQSVPIHNGSSNGVTNAVSASSPPRPAPKGSGAVDRPGRPSGRPDSKTVTEALRNGIEPGHRASPAAYERGPELARKLLADKRKPP